ncbi:MAG: BNR-4 repeat-containing protein [Polyangiaceae bacterium]|nr:BNR-4 repeat-containing protein [Polyangiaceae bacterium]
MENAFCLVLLASTVLACSSSSDNQNNAGAGSGGDSLGGSSATGAQSSGGSAASNTGGAPSGGTSSGGVASGGLSPTGGNSGELTGGATSNGGDTGLVGGGGGTTPAGGTSAGGTTPAGGTTQSGGRQPTGGRTGTGTGGRSTGGGGGTSGETTGGNGGATDTGGATSSGGAEPTGGTGGGGTPTCEVPTAAPGEPIVFNDNGGWCWYQDERVLVDVEANKLIIGSVAIGGSRGGQQEAVIYDLAGGGNPQRATIGRGLGPDDHNTPALVQLSSGKYLAVWTGHNENCNSYYNVYNNGSWGSQQTFDWGPIGCPTPDNRTISYSNLWQMPGRIFNFVRSFETSPNLATTPDGSTFAYVGRLTATPQVGYVRGYYKYWGNNVDRIDFCGTESHPRDNSKNSLYHGYIKATESSITTYDSAGTQKGTIDQASKSGAPSITAFTKLFGSGDQIGGVTLTNMWNHDIVRYDDGTVVVLGQGRVSGTGSDDPDKRFIYLRFDGSKWSTTYLVKGGSKLYNDEQDYTGLSAAHPNNPYTIYVSTRFDPRDDTTQSSKREIWRGTTCDQGKTFTWTQITKNSTEDNIRPVVPYWPGNKTALLWMRGNYLSAQTYQTKVVGLILDGP